MTKTLQAKHVPDRLFLAAVDRCAGDNLWGDGEPRWVLRWEVEEALPTYPPKVLLAKARSLIRRGLMAGCGCGCRGDYRVTDAGRAVLAGTPTGPLAVGMDVSEAEGPVGVPGVGQLADAAATRPAPVVLPEP